MTTAKLTIRLPIENIEFAKQYAKEHRMTVTELINRQLQGLRGQEDSGVHPEVARIVGLVPEEIDVREEHVRYLLEKHR